MRPQCRPNQPGNPGSFVSAAEIFVWLLSAEARRVATAAHHAAILIFSWVRLTTPGGLVGIPARAGFVARDLLYRRDCSVSHSGSGATVSNSTCITQKTRWGRLQGAYADEEVRRYTLRVSILRAAAIAEGVGLV